MSDIWIPESLDLTNCDIEPIHIPGSIQSHGVFLVVDPESFQIVQCSENTLEHLATPAHQILGQSITIIIGEQNTQLLKASLISGDFRPINANVLNVQATDTTNEYTLYAHRALDDRLIVELELIEKDAVSVTFDYTLYSVLDKISKDDDIVAVCNNVAATIQDYVGFDRVMIYRFDPNWNGEVIAESHIDSLDSYLGLHYPASDIPKQARQLYTLNPLRIISDVNSKPVSLLSIEHNKSPVDMSFAQLRSVSPIHIEYLSNMGVGASMSISIIIDDKLWGLIACHHMSAKIVNQHKKIACTILARTLSLIIVEKERSQENLEQAETSRKLTEIFESMHEQEGDLILKGLLTGEPNLLDLIPAHGVALLFDDEVTRIGKTPDEASIKEIAEWLTETHTDNLYLTDHLGLENPVFKKISDSASGLLAITISTPQKEYIFWFKPEQTQIVSWGGNPEKRVIEDENGTVRLSPRKSFEAWQQLVENTSLPWSNADLNTARRLRALLIDTAVKIAGELRLRAKILAALNEELERSNTELDSFAYVASHDLKEPLRGIHNYAAFLLEDYRSILPDEGIEKITTLIRLSQRLEAFIDALLEFSRVGRIDLSVKSIDLNTIIEDTLTMLRPRLDETKTEVRFSRTFPTLTVDALRIAEVFSNLISNSIKYNDKAERWIEIGQIPNPNEGYVTFYVQDNGIGIKGQHAETIFRIFKRLHGRDSFGGGTGAGLTIAKKIVERHQGRIWIESDYGKGTTFFFTLKDLRNE